MHVVEHAGVPFGTAGEAGYTEQLRTADLSLGTYVVPRGADDPQQPHTEDEVYWVTAGRARLVTPTASADVRPGSVLLVPAGEPHRFADVTEDLTVVVVFGPAEYRRSATADGNLTRASTPVAWEGQPPTPEEDPP